MNALLRGALAGAAATVPMSAVMLGLRKRMGEQPPDVITTQAAHAVGKEPTENQADALASVAHVVFGAVSGAAYAALPKWGPPPLRGVLTGLAIWASAYQGVVPALRIMPPASEDQPKRPAVMIAAHVVYGAVLGTLEQRLRKR
jgi:uncharacterized membrane protein YagU involved in acid resistance